MPKIAPAALCLAGAVLLAPIHAALAISTEDAPTNSDGTAQATDPDDALDNLADPAGGTGGSATIEVPPIAVPDDGDDSGDYVSPDADDNPDAGSPAPQSSDGSMN